MFGKNKEKPFPVGPLYDLADGKVYQTEDGYTFFPVGSSSILESGCSECTSNTCNLPSSGVIPYSGGTRTTNRTITTVPDDSLAATAYYEGITKTKTRHICRHSWIYRYQKGI